MHILRNFSAVISGYASEVIAETRLYFDRRENPAVEPNSLAPYTQGDHHLYLKQVPSALTLRKAGSRLAPGVKSVLLEDGFNLFKAAEADQEEESEEGSSFNDYIDSLSENEEEIDIPYQEIPDTGINYEDPFRVFAGWAYASRFSGENLPRIHVWPGGCHRIQGKIQPALCGSDRKNATWFTQISDHGEKMYLISNHTHWGHRIQVERHSKRDADGKYSKMKHFSETLWRRISHLLAGKGDPLWTQEERQMYNPADARKNNTFRAQRLLEVLKTVDGIFTQRFFSYPEEEWNWEKYDLFVLQSLSILITDEFLDLHVSDSTTELKTYYAQLKTARKLFKSVIHRDEPLKFEGELDVVPRWVDILLGGTWRKAMRTSGYERMFLSGLLSQTRGAGTPPSLVVLQSKMKFLRSVQETPPEYTPTQRALVGRAFDSLMDKLPEEIFTGLSTKARVTVTGSACWEETRKDGGTAQAVMDILSKYEDNLIPVRNLDTGKVDEWFRKEQFESIGTAVFYACLQEVMETNPHELSKVYLTLVKEPGKARSVTKGPAALKIVLDTVSKICSHPLKKGFKSSESGMGKSHHGWNLFKDFTSEEMYNMLFTESVESTTDTYIDHLKRVIVWEDCYSGSTDFQEATDRMIHEFADQVSDRWMKKCGIPPLLQGIVRAVCFRPRQVYFSGSGPLSSMGRLVEGDTRVITLLRGVLMGDPLTKIILHFSNIITREIGSSLTSGELFTHFRNGNEAMEAYRKILHATS